MTKEQFIKMYGQPNTVVSFKNDAEKMEFLKECDRFDIKWLGGQNATRYKSQNEIICLNLGECLTGFRRDTSAEIPYTLSPKSLIKDGWMGVQRAGAKAWFIPSTNLYVYDSTHSVYSFETGYDEYMNNKTSNHHDIVELYDNLGNLQWKREEKSAKDIEIERIQAEMNKLAQDLNKLKGE